MRYAKEGHLPSSCGTGMGISIKGRGSIISFKIKELMIYWKLMVVGG